MLDAYARTEIVCVQNLFAAQRSPDVLHRRRHHDLSSVASTADTHNGWFQTNDNWDMTGIYRRGYSDTGAFAWYTGTWAGGASINQITGSNPWWSMAA